MRKVLTAEQTAKRDERKTKFRALWKQVADTPELDRIQLANKLGFTTCEGHSLSIGNQMLIALQNPTASVLGGFRQWLKHGRAVRKGEHGAMIWVPTGGRKNDVALDGTAGGVSAVVDGQPSGENDTRFIIGTLFDIGQTDEVNASEAEESKATTSDQKINKVTTMPTKTVQLDDATRSILLRSKIDGKNLHLPGQLPRPDYVRVAKAIEAAGGKWNRKAGCHVFPDDVRETLDIKQDSVEVVNVQQAFQAFYTPKELAKELIELAQIEPKHRVLEPSAGAGSLLLALHESIPISNWPNLKIVAVEINPKAAKSLSQYTNEVKCTDFLSLNGELGKFDRVVMNPPFSRGDDIKHILHARHMLNPGGRLVAICANGPRQKEQLKPLASEWIDLPAGSFSESGTDVNTAMLVIEAPDAAEMSRIETFTPETEAI